MTSDRKRTPFFRSIRWRGHKLPLVLVLVCLTVPVGRMVQAQAPDDSGKERTAYRYMLKKGEQYPLCRAFAKVLDSYGPLPDFACNIPVRATFGPFREINWKPVDPKSERGLAALELVAARTKRRGATDDVWQQRWEEEFRESYVSFVENGTARLEEAQFDLDSNGTIDRVYRFGQLSCPSPAPSHPESRRWTNFVLPQDAPELFEEIEKHASISLAAADPFYFDGRVFYPGYIVDPSTLFIAEIGRVPSLGSAYQKLVCEFERTENIELK